MFARNIACWLIATALCAVPFAVSASVGVDTLLQRANAVRSSDPSKFQSLLNQLNAERELATPRQAEQIDYLNAYAQGYAGKYDLAIVATRKLMDRSSDAAIKLRAGSLMVNSYAATREFTEGLRQLERNLVLVDKVADKNIRQHALGVAAVLYNEIGQYRRALQYSDQMFSDQPDGRALCFAGQFRLESLYNLDELPADDGPIRQVIEQCSAQGERVLTNFVRLVLARKWATHTQRDKAISLLQEHLAEVEATQYPRLISETHSLLAELMLAKGDVVSAEYHALVSVARSSHTEFSLPLVIAYKTLYEIARQRHDPEIALARYRQYAEADKGYLNEVKTRELAYQIVRQETLQKSQQIELLDRKNQVLQLQQRVDRQSAQYSRLMIVLLVFLMGSIVFWAFKIKRVQLSLRRMAQTDALTGIFNRHYFTQQSEHTLAQCARAGEDVALIMFDLDHFKSINDRFGHDVGDWALKRVTDACKTFCRRIDHLGRIGGEEFAILLSGCDLRGATRVAEDCRVRIASIDTSPSGRNKFLITASFGVTASSLSGYDLVKLLSHADQMLYRAKRDGRNRVATFDGQVPNWSPLQSVPGSEQAAGQGPVAVESGAS